MILGSRPAYRRASAHELLSVTLTSSRSWANERITWLSLLGACGLVAALYGHSLGFGFFFDDTFDLTRTEGRSYWSLLASSEGYSYYRPIPFLIWKFLRQVQGQYDQATLHALPLIAHALAGWLLFLLVRRLGFGAWAMFPAILFLTYPFNYQSVAIAGTLFHPLAGAAILAALVFYLMARESPPGRRQTLLHCAALACTFVALWSHESGIVVAPLLAALEALVLVRCRKRRPSPWLCAHLGAALLFIFTWLTVERTPFGERTDLGELHPKGLFLLQGFTFPFSAQLVWFDDHFGWSPGILEAGLAALGLVFGAFTVAGWRSGTCWRGIGRGILAPACALGLAVVAFAPALATLSYSYVEDSPRLLYLVGIGSAIFWGLLPSLDFRHPRVTLIWRVATCLLLLGVVAQSWRFIDVRITMFSRGTEVVDAVVAHGEQYRGQRALIVNSPAWFAQERYEYHYGHYGIQLIPSYIGLDRVIYTSSSYSAFTEAASASWNADVSGAVYAFGPHGTIAPPEQLDTLLREGYEVVDVRPHANGFIVRDVGRLVPGGAEPRDEFPGSFASTVWVSTSRVALTADSLTLVFAWHVTDTLTQDVNATIEIRDASGDPVAAYAGYPLAGYSAPRLWQPGDRVDDSVFFVRPTSGEYTIWAGLRTVATDELFPAQPSPDNPSPDNMLQIGAFSVP